MCSELILYMFNCQQGGLICPIKMELRFVSVVRDLKLLWNCNCDLLLWGLSFIHFLLGVFIMKMCNKLITAHLIQVGCYFMD